MHMGLHTHRCPRTSDRLSTASRSPPSPLGNPTTNLWLAAGCLLQLLCALFPTFSCSSKAAPTDNNHQQNPCFYATAAATATPKGERKSP
jgi:hypothetical protein